MVNRLFFRRLVRAGFLVFAALAFIPLALPADLAAASPVSGAAPAASAVGPDAAFLNGTYSLARGNMAHAAEDFLTALSWRPDDPVLLRRGFVASLLSGNPAALRLARALPDDDAALMLRAAVAARKGTWAAAQRLIRALPRDGQAGVLRPLLLAWAEQGAGRTEAALATLAPRESGAHPQAIYLLHAGLIADLAGRTAVAAGLYHRAEAALHGGDLRSGQIFASFDARHGKRAAALRRLDALARTTPEFAIALPGLAASLAHRPIGSAAAGMAEAFLGLGATLRASDQPDSALLMLRLALAARPEFAAARLLAADILAAQIQEPAPGAVREGTPEPAREALALLDGIPVNDPLAAVAQLQTADVLRRLGRDQEALRLLRRLARLAPDSPLPLAEQGDILRETGHFRAAVAAYTQALARSGTATKADWAMFYDRGVAYDRAGDWPKAEADFKRALQVSPNQPLVLNYLGYSWADRGDHLAEAERMIEAANRLLPDNAAVTDSLGWVRLRQGQIAQAVDLLQRAAELAPLDATINFHLGDAYWAVGRKIEARYQWQRALTLHPDAAEAVRLQKRLLRDTDAGGRRAPAKRLAGR